MTARDLLFTFKTREVADGFDLTRIGPVMGAAPDGLQVVVEPEDEWATADNLNLTLLTFGLHDEVIITSRDAVEDSDN